MKPPIDHRQLTAGPNFVTNIAYLLAHLTRWCLHFALGVIKVADLWELWQVTFNICINLDRRPLFYISFYHGQSTSSAVHCQDPRVTKQDLCMTPETRERFPTASMIIYTQGWPPWLHSSPSGFTTFCERANVIARRDHITCCCNSLTNAQRRRCCGRRRILSNNCAMQTCSAGKPEDTYTKGSIVTTTSSTWCVCLFLLFHLDSWLVERGGCFCRACNLFLPTGYGWCWLCIDVITYRHVYTFFFWNEIDMYIPGPDFYAGDAVHVYWWGFPFCKHSRMFLILYICRLY